MSSAVGSSYVLIRRLADGTVEWIPLEVAAQGVPVVADAAYTLVDRADYEAPDALVAQRRGEDLVVEVQGDEVVVLRGFYTNADVTFYPTTNIAGGAGPFSGSPLTADSPVLAGSSAGEQVVWSAEPTGGKAVAAASEQAGAGSTAPAAGGAVAGSSGGGSPLLWVGVAAGGLGLAAAAGGGGGGSSGGGGGGPPVVVDTVAPTITSGTTATAIAENSGAGQVVYTTTATDAGTISYSLRAVGDAAAFTINANTGAVTLTGDPNFETKSTYTFTVAATDAANNSSERAVTLAINNRDEVAPTITSGATATAINENSGAGQVVYTVTSTDTGDISGGVTYSLKAGGDAAAFTINANTGAVSLTGNPDFETKPSYNFTVVATDAASNSTERAVSLAINNLPDTPVTITSGAGAAPIDENSGGAHVVYTVVAIATAPGPLTYSLKAGGDAAAFTINANTGLVTLTGNPDFETKPSYNFTVVATDTASNIGEQPVSLAINNRDEVAPTITSSATAPPLNENTGPGQVVYTVTSTDTGDISTGSTIYSIKAVGDAAAFTIDANTGAVSFTPNPDFETKTSYNFTVVATDAAGNHSEKAVTLAIIDRDEVAPTITSGPATPINENSGAGQVIYTVTATDTDPVTYSLKAGVADVAAFTINAASGAVRLTGNPNFEAKPVYNFTVVATDAANNSSERPVVLTINNLDEVAPTITSGATATAINENSGTSQVVYTVTSTDTGDISGGVTYSLKPAVGDFAAFTINSTSGAVRLTGNPNFEAKSTYAFTVVATDAAGNRTEQPVSLAINNLDEVAPTITSGATATAINENSGAGQVVYTVTSTDTGDISGGVTYSLKPAVGDFAAFSINGSTGAVTLTANPDDETKGSYTFTVVATDAALNSDEQAVSLNINDLDEVAPTITSGATAPAINENSGAGQVVYTVTSTDTGDVSGGVTYSLKPAVGDFAAFSINANTGAVTLTGNPNFEAKPSYNFTVVATDAALNSSERAVVLTINNLDEVAPTITSGSTAPAINENSGANQVVYTVTSTDTGDISGGVTYSLKPGVGDVAAFTINAGTGAVRLTGNPDFETKASYNFTVVATDAASHSVEQAVSLAINDLDEVAPTITSGGTAPAINENSGAGQVVYTVTATDTGPITYSLKPAVGDFAAFSINGSTGAVTLTANPDDETKGSYNFTVVATDAAGNFDEQAVSLNIIDLDEVAPTITSGATAPAINENSGAGQVVYTVTSTDTGDVSGGVTYSLKPAVGDFAAFSINASTGAVTLTANPNFEAKPSYNFTVVATDAASNTDEQAVSLTINNLDEVAPTITSGSTAPAINENSGANQVVYTVTSTDTGDISGGVTYSLKPGVGDVAAFTINAGTGAVRLTGNPDFEAKPSYNFTVVATDAASHSVEQAVSLAINDLDEVAPTITSGGTAPAINENSGAGQVVYTVTATDTGPITYSLKSVGDFAAFSINGSTGAVTLTANPDDETKGSYTFTVVATDAALNSDEQAVSLNINDLDEVAPTITSGATAPAINENSGAGQVVYTVTSTDTGDVSGGVTYSLKAVDDAAAFTINGSTGAVTLTADPDDETKGSYSFTVVATDAALNNDEQAVSLNINDLDEVAPTITSLATAPAIDENTGAGQVIYTVTSTDTGDISGGVTYSLKLVDDVAAFSIDANSGDVTLIGDPDFEAQSSYNFTVVATDAALNSSEQSVSLAVNDDPLSFMGFAFGLVQDSSSDGGRVFQSASEEIDVRVALDDPTLISVDSIWGGSANFGSDDRATLVASGADALDPSAATHQMSFTDAAAGFDPATSIVDAFLDGARGETNVNSFASMPAVIVTSQGLA